MNTRRWATLGLTMLLGAGVSAICGAQTPPSWHAGVAKADITPAESMWVAGYASRKTPSDGTLHPLWLKALALQDVQGQRAVIVTSDHLGFPKGMSDRIRDRIKERLGLERGQILLSSSHTHSGPVLDDSLLCIYPLDDTQRKKITEYSRMLEDKTVETAVQAFHDLVPVQLASGSGVTRFAVNRRTNKEAEILDTHDLNGPVDHAVPVLKVARADGSLLAVLFGYACHSTVLDLCQWSGDYPGFAQIELEKTYPGCTAMFFAGCGADQNPLPRRTIAIARQYGRELAAAVERVIADPMQTLDPSLKIEYADIELALEAPPTREQFEAMLPTSPWFIQDAIKGFIKDLDAGKPLRTSYPYPVQMWRLGAQNLVALGGEVVVDYAILVKQVLGRDTFVAGYANDVMSYIPSRRVLREGGYEGKNAQPEYGMPNAYREDIEERILTAVRDQAQRAGATPIAAELPSTQ